MRQPGSFGGVAILNCRLCCVGVLRFAICDSDVSSLSVVYSRALAEPISLHLATAVVPSRLFLFLLGGPSSLEVLHIEDGLDRWYASHIQFFKAIRRRFRHRTTLSPSLA